MKVRAMAVVAALMMSPVAPWSATARASTPPPFFKMTGGGKILAGDEAVRFGLTLECPPQTTNNGQDEALVIHAPDWSFRLTDALSALCDPNDPEDNDDGGTHEGTGEGICTASDGSTDETGVTWELIDGGKGNPDAVDFTVGEVVPVIERVTGEPQLQSECAARVAGTPKGDILFGMSMNHTEAFLAA